jgi:hypothetical protein
MQQEPEQWANPNETRTNTKIPEQKQGWKQKQITTHLCTEKQRLQQSTKHQVQNKPNNQARQKRKSKTKKSRWTIQCWARQRRQKELEWETHHQKTYDNQINQQKSSFNQLMLRKSGLIAHTSKSRWDNVQQILLQMPAEHYFNCPNNIAIQNLHTSPKDIPPKALSLLGLGLNFCNKHKYPTNKIKKSINQFSNDIRSKQLFFGLKDYYNFIPQLYIKDPHWVAPAAEPKVEQCLQRFTVKFQAEQ